LLQIPEFFSQKAIAMRFLLLTLPSALLKFSLYFLVFCTPILGVWLVSSLVAFTNGSTWLAVGSGILLFPLLPIIWDLWGRRKRQAPGILTWGDRITLRTLLLNLTFIACLLALRPQPAFLALSTRGDWMLDGQQGQPVELVRQGLFGLASQLEGFYRVVHQNPYEQYGDTTGIQPTPTDRSPATNQPVRPGQSTRWPWSDVGLHPAVANMPASVETSIESVAKYIAQREKDPFLRVKALHDYAADRIAYDAPSYVAHQYPPQDAQTVFARRNAVCAGYAELLKALGEAIGEEIIVVTGDSRSQSSDLSGQSHAWNAAKIEGNWYLIDATWDSGYVKGSEFTKQFRLDYLFPPPEALVISHFPTDPVWQLLSKPVSLGDFLRQPMLRPQFFADGLKLITPSRSQTDVQGDPIIQVENPQQKWLVASYGIKDSKQSENCQPQASQNPQIVCPLPASGTYTVSLFSGDKQAGPYDYVGQMEFNKQQK
jgi:hypothetical protein